MCLLAWFLFIVTLISVMHAYAMPLCEILFSVTPLCGAIYRIAVCMMPFSVISEAFYLHHALPCVTFISNDDDQKLTNCFNLDHLFCLDLEFVFWWLYITNRGLNFIQINPDCMSFQEIVATILANKILDRENEAEWVKNSLVQRYSGALVFLA